MRGLSEEQRWTVLEKIGAYAAGDLEGEEAREAERLILESEDHQRLAESYARLLAALSMLGQESPAAPEAVVSYAVRRAYVAAFLRQAEQFSRGLVEDYLGALALYLNLRPARRSGP